MVARNNTETEDIRSKCGAFTHSHISNEKIKQNHLSIRLNILDTRIFHSSTSTLLFVHFISFFFIFV